MGSVVRLNYYKAVPIRLRGSWGSAIERENANIAVPKVPARVSQTLFHSKDSAPRSGRSTCLERIFLMFALCVSIMRRLSFFVQVSVQGTLNFVDETQFPRDRLTLNQWLSCFLDAISVSHFHIFFFTRS